MSLKKGIRVVKIPVTLENLSKVDMLVESFSGKVDKKMMEQYFGGDDQLIFDKILSGTSKDGAVYFEVPTDAKELILVYDYGFWVDKKVEFKIPLK